MLEGLGFSKTEKGERITSLIRELILSKVFVLGSPSLIISKTVLSETYLHEIASPHISPIRVEGCRTGWKRHQSGVNRRILW